jgi:two-component system, sensor histidine kinase LadS
MRVNKEGLMAELPPHPKDDVAAAILRAQGDLEHALAQLARLPAFDPMAIGLATHALTNYLTVMHAGVQLLQQAWQARDEPRILALLQNVEHATNLMQNAVAQLRGVTMVGPRTLVRRPVDVALFVQRVCDYYQPLAARKELRLFCEVAGEPRMLETDPVALAAVLDNLLSNAVKFSPPGRRIWLTADCQDDRVRWQMRDEGPGLSAEEQARLFQAGVRLSPQPTAGEPSSGYGLAVAKQLMDQLGGSIEYESQPGPGATFVVSLPN